MLGLTYTGQSWSALMTSTLGLEQLVGATTSLRPNTLPREGVLVTAVRGSWVPGGQGWGEGRAVPGVSPHLAQMPAGGRVAWARGVW